MTALLALLKNWRVILGAAGVVLVVGVWAYVTHLRHVAAAGKQQAAQAQQAVQIQTATTKAVDQVATQTQVIHERTHEIVQTIQQAPGANSEVPPDVLAAWRSGLSNDAADPPT